MTATLEDSSAISVAGDPHTAHLLSQITFLHNEVERLESLLVTVRKKSSAEEAAVVKRYQDIIAEKNAELREWKLKLGKLGDDDNLSKRCHALEKQLAAVASDRSVLNMEKNDLNAKVRKLEGVIKELKQHAVAAQQSASEKDASTSGQLLQLRNELESTQKDRDTLRKKLQSLRSDIQANRDKTTTEESSPVITSAAETQTDALLTGLKQDESTQASFTTPLDLPDGVTDSVYHIAQRLETKVQEADALKVDLEQALSAREGAQTELISIKEKLAEERERSAVAVDECEKLTHQVRALQQKLGEHSAGDRELRTQIEYLTESRELLHAKVAASENESTQLKQQIQQYEKDLEQLIANKNHTNHQLNALSNENEQLRGQVRKLTEREAHLLHTLKCKDDEIHEIVDAYRTAVQETDSHAESLRALENELDSVRAALASREEGFLHLQEQVSDLHKREQQLLLDTQTYEFQNEQMHRKILHLDNVSTQAESKCAELLQVVRAKDLIIEELHQNLSELSKQVVIKDNENVLLQRHCDEVEAEVSHLRASSYTQAERTKALEESNARMVTRDVLAQAKANEVATLSEQLTQLKKQNRQMSSALKDAQKEKESLEKTLAEARAESVDLKKSNESLHKLIVEQTKTFSHLSK